MAKRERKGYFYEEQEDAVKEYLVCDDERKKNQIFNNTLLPAFTTMIESIIRRYNLHIPNEEFDETFNDTISFLMSKIEHFDPEKISQKTGKAFKAYSYCGTVCKNYLLHRRIEYGKELERMSSYDVVCDDLNDDNRFISSYNEDNGLANDLMKEAAKGIKKIMKDCDIHSLSEKELIVGDALIDLLENWEDILEINGGNKLGKSVVLYHLREKTRLSTKEIRDSMKKYKKSYYILKENIVSEF